MLVQTTKHPKVWHINQNILGCLPSEICQSLIHSLELSGTKAIEKGCRRKLPATPENEHIPDDFRDFCLLFASKGQIWSNLAKKWGEWVPMGPVTSFLLHRAHARHGLRPHRKEWKEACRVCSGGEGLEGLEDRVFDGFRIELSVGVSMVFLWFSTTCAMRIFDAKGTNLPASETVLARSLQPENSQGLLKQPASFFSFIERHRKHDYIVFVFRFCSTFLTQFYSQNMSSYYLVELQPAQFHTWCISFSSCKNMYSKQL